jgi:hypothetical protein
MRFEYDSRVDDEGGSKSIVEKDKEEEWWKLVLKR